MNQQMNQYLSEEKIGKLMLKFAIPCITSLLVSSLYNIVDQIFIGRGVGFLGNGATNVVFPITVIALALALMIGDAAAAFLSICQGKKDTESAHKTVGNAIVLITILGIVLTVFFLVFREPILKIFGVTENNIEYAREYFDYIAIGLPFYMFGITINAIIRADGNPQYSMLSVLVGCQPIVGFNYGAKKYQRVKKVYTTMMKVECVVGILAFLAFQLFPLQITKIFGSEDALYNEFAVLAFRIFLSTILLSAVQKATSIFFQSLGMPVKAFGLSVIRDFIVNIPMILLLPKLFGVIGALLSAPIADLVAFVVCIILISITFRQLSRLEANA